MLVAPSLENSFHYSFTGCPTAQHHPDRFNNGSTVLAPASAASKAAERYHRATLQQDTPMAAAEIALFCGFIKTSAPRLTLVQLQHTQHFGLYGGGGNGGRTSVSSTSGNGWLLACECTARPRLYLFLSREGIRKCKSKFLMKFIRRVGRTERSGAHFMFSLINFLCCCQRS